MGARALRSEVTPGGGAAREGCEGAVTADLTGPAWREPRAESRAGPVSTLPESTLTRCLVMRGAGQASSSTIGVPTALWVGGSDFHSSLNEDNSGIHVYIFEC